jgi:hypothetical protein
MRLVLRSSALALGAVMLAAGALRAQLPFDGKTGWSIGPTAQSWSFGCCSGDSAPASLKSAQQFTLPLSGAFAIGKRLLVDGYVAYVMGNATARDSAGFGGEKAHVNGFTDMTVRAGLKLHGDDAMITVGLNLPTGLTDLDSSQFAAMRVLGSPVLQAMSPVLGAGFSATAGMVYAKKIGGWAWGAGASYQYRTEYSPMQAAALGLGTSVTNVTLAPGSAIRVSIGTDGLVGSGAMAFSGAVTFFTQDQMTRTLPGDTLLTTDVTLGPMLQGEWRWRTQASGFRTISVFAYDRFISRYTSAGKVVPGTNGNFFYMGANGISPLNPNFGIVSSLHMRWLTGLSIDNTLATAATFTGGLGLGVSWVTGPVTLTPIVGAEFGQINSGVQKFGVSEWQVSFTVASR